MVLVSLFFISHAHHHLSFSLTRSVSHPALKMAAHVRRPCALFSQRSHPLVRAACLVPYNSHCYVWGEINEYANEGQRGTFAGIDAATGCCGYVCASLLLGGIAQVFFSGAVSATLERKLVIISSICLTHTYVSHAKIAPQRHSELDIVSASPRTGCCVSVAPNWLLCQRRPELVVVPASLRTGCCVSVAPNWLWTGTEFVGGDR
jgi:hypothetical protein